MADRYVVNNESLVATADAIRAKSGNTEGIIWDGSTGFADAIEGLGSSVNIVSGVFLVDNADFSAKLLNSPVTVSGLGFKPSKVFVYHIGNTTLSALSESSSQWINFIESDAYQLLFSYDSSTGTITQYCYTNAYGKITMIDDGFIIEAANQYLSGCLHGDYRYVAIG